MMLPLFQQAQGVYKRILHWSDILEYQITEEEKIYQVYFEGAIYNPGKQLLSSVLTFATVIFRYEKD